LEVLRPADEEQERRRLEDLLEKLGQQGASRKRRRIAQHFAPCALPSQKISGSSFVRLSNVDCVVLSFVILPGTLAEFRLFR